MKVQFYKAESRLFDLFKFGKILFLNGDEKEYDETYQQWIKDIQKNLEKERIHITLFYQTDEYATHDLNQLLFNAFPLFGYTKDSYFKYLLSQSSDVLKTKLYEALVTSSQASVDQYPNPITFIQNLETDNAYKWQLLLLIDHPLKVIEDFKRWIDSIEPLFDQYYQSYEQAVANLGVSLESTLQHGGSESVELLSKGRIKGLLQNTNTVHLLISVMFKYEVMINPKKDILNLIWGLNMEEAFKTMAEKDISSSDKRVLVFKNLGDKTRYEVIKLISSGMTSVKEIASKIGVSSATISYHISELLKSNIVTLENQNKKFSYVIDYDYLAEIFEALKQDLNFPIS